MPTREYLEGELHILDELLQRRYGLSTAVRDWAESTRAGLRDQLAALPPDPAPLDWAAVVEECRVALVAASNRLVLDSSPAGELCSAALKRIAAAKGGGE